MLANASRGRHSVASGALARRFCACCGSRAGRDQASTASDARVDPSIKPGDDFFAYANGGWLKATAIPAGQGALERARRDRRADPPAGRDAARRRAGTAPAGSVARKVADFRAA